MSDRQTNDDELTLDSVRESGYHELNTLEEVNRFKKLSLLSSVARFSAVYLTLKTVPSLKHRKLDIHSNVASVISISSCSSCSTSYLKACPRSGLSSAHQMMVIRCVEMKLRFGISGKYKI